MTLRASGSHRISLQRSHKRSCLRTFNDEVIGHGGDDGGLRLLNIRTPPRIYAFRIRDRPTTASSLPQCENQKEKRKKRTKRRDEELFTNFQEEDRKVSSIR